MINKYIRLVGIIYLLASCNNFKDKSIDKYGFDKKLSHINISFANKPDIDSKFYFNDKLWIGKMNLVEIFNGTDHERFDVSPERVPNPITVNPKKKYVVLRHYINYLDYNDYLLYHGDSVIVRYMDKKPHVTIVNRKIFNFDNNVEELSRKCFFDRDYSPLSAYFGVRDYSAKRILNSKEEMVKSRNMSLEQKDERIQKYMQEFRQYFYNDAIKYLKIENKILDSLNVLGEISEISYTYYKERAKYYNYLMDVETFRIKPIEMRNVLISHQSKNPTYTEAYYYELLTGIANTYFVNKVPFFSLEDVINRDYRLIYNLIDTSSLLPTAERNYLLTQEIKRIRNAFSLSEFHEYFNRYEKKVKDSLIVASVKEEFAVDFDESRLATETVVLTDLSGNKHTLDELKNQHKGKVLYLDFWASWCAPCREALPKSAELRQALRDKDVVFVYLSIDSNVKNWKKASSAEQLDRYDQNYLVINSQNAEFMKSTKLNEIPRYMIFDKNGRLLYPNAPRVGSSETGILLTKLAAK